MDHERKGFKGNCDGNDMDQLIRGVLLIRGVERGS